MPVFEPARTQQQPSAHRAASVRWTLAPHEQDCIIGQFPAPYYDIQLRWERGQSHDVLTAAHLMSTSERLARITARTSVSASFRSPAVARSLNRSLRSSASTMSKAHRLRRNPGHECAAVCRLLLESPERKISLCMRPRWWSMRTVYAEFVGSVSLGGHQSMPSTRDNDAWEVMSRS